MAWCCHQGMGLVAQGGSGSGQPCCGNCSLLPAGVSPPGCGQQPRAPSQQFPWQPSPPASRLRWQKIKQDDTGASKKKKGNPTTCLPPPRGVGSLFPRSHGVFAGCLGVLLCKEEWEVMCFEGCCHRLLGWELGNGSCASWERGTAWVFGPTAI